MTDMRGKNAGSKDESSSGPNWLAIALIGLLLALGYGGYTAYMAKHPAAPAAATTQSP